MATSSLVTTTTTRALHEYSSQHHHDDPPATNTVSSSRIQCPCEKFAALSKIVDTLDSEETMRSLLDWLDGRTDERALQQHQLLSCGKRSRCRFRYGTSFAILNAIRNACRQHLDHTTNLDDGGGNSDEVEGFSTPASKSSTAKPSISYDEAFPSLQSATASANTTTEPTPKPHVAAANILVPRKKPQHQQSKMATDTEVEQPNNTILVPKKKKNKRRIRPAQVTESVDSKGLHNHSVWNTVQQQQPLMISSNPNPNRNSRDLPWKRIQSCIMVGGFPATTSQLQRSQLTNLDMRSLHVIGINDTSVPPSLGHELSTRFCDPKILEHAKGHVVPQQTRNCSAIIEFLLDTSAMTR